MTDSPHPAETIDAAGPVAGDRFAPPVHTELIAADRDDIIDVVLEGGPATLPEELRSHRVARVEEKIKVPHYGGYEHFECESAEPAAGCPVVYRWTGRTLIAE